MIQKTMTMYTHVAKKIYLLLAAWDKFFVIVCYNGDCLNWLIMTNNISLTHGDTSKTMKTYPSIICDFCSISVIDGLV